MSEPDFGEQMSALCTKELSHARRDADRMGAMIEGIARSLGFTIAIATNGDPKGIEMMMMGAENYAADEAMEKAKFARAFAGLKPCAPRPEEG